MLKVLHLVHLSGCILYKRPHKGSTSIDMVGTFGAEKGLILILLDRFICSDKKDFDASL